MHVMYHAQTTRVLQMRDRIYELQDTLRGQGADRTRCDRSPWRACIMAHTARALQMRDITLIGCRSYNIQSGYKTQISTVQLFTMEDMHHGPCDTCAAAARSDSGATRYTQDATRRLDSVRLFTMERSLYFLCGELVRWLHAFGASYNTYAAAAISDARCYKTLITQNKIRYQIRCDRSPWRDRCISCAPLLPGTPAPKTGHRGLPRSPRACVASVSTFNCLEGMVCRNQPDLTA